jgi:glycosyltransferase involved in cell wall biosynthesis
MRAPLMQRIVYPSDWQVVGLQPQILVRAGDEARPLEVRVVEFADFNGHGPERAPARARVALERGARWLEGRVAAPLEEGRYILCLDDARTRRAVHMIGVYARASADQWSAAFERMLRSRLARAHRGAARADGAPLFSVTTTVYDTDPLFFDALAACLQEQTFGDFEWLILDNGSTSAATVQAMVRAAARDPRVRLFRVEQNLHIIGGNRYLLERARGRFIVPVDSDDIVYPDALGVLAGHCARADAAAVYFSDEQKVDPLGAPAELVWRPAWSGLSALATCPAAHLMAYDREQGIAAGAYTEDYARGSHDWDTMLRMADAGAKPCRVSEVLYGWRMHPQSSALTEQAKEYLRASQVAVLERSLQRRGIAARFAIEQVTPAIGYYHHVRRQEASRPLAVDFVLRAGETGDYANLLHNLRSLGHPPTNVRVIQAGRAARWRLALLRARCQRHVPWLVVEEAGLGAAACEIPPGVYAKAIVDCAHRMEPSWLWDALGTLELDAETAIVTGPIVDSRDRVRSAGYVAGLDGFVGTPLPGEPLPAVPGALALMRRHVTAAHGGLLVLRAEACSAIGPLEGIDDDDALNGIELCLRAAARGMRTAYSPRMKAVRTRALRLPVGASDPARRARIAERYAGRLEHDAYYARYLVRESARYGQLEAGACT